MSETTVSRIRLVDLNEYGFMSLTALQRDMESACVFDGGARWLPLPFGLGKGTIDMATDTAGVLVRVEITADHEPADLSWMAAKAYAYALYTGAVDQLKRKAVWVGRGRYIGAGLEETCDAHVGDVHISVKVSIMDCADLSR